MDDYVFVVKINLLLMRGIHSWCEKIIWFYKSEYQTLDEGDLLRSKATYGALLGQGVFPGHTCLE